MLTSSLLEEERKDTNEFLRKKAASFKEKAHKRNDIRKGKNSELDVIVFDLVALINQNNVIPPGNQTNIIVALFFIHLNYYLNLSMHFQRKANQIIITMEFTILSRD